jgi:Fic family protein
MPAVGFEFVRQTLNLPAFPIEGAAASGNYTAIHRLADGTLAVPRASAPPEGSGHVVRHLLFGLRHEHLQLQVLALAAEKLDPDEILAELKSTPSGAFVRKLCYLYEAFTQRTLDTSGIEVSGPYVKLLNPDEYFTGPVRRNTKWRVDFNGVADLRWCPLVRKTETIERLLGSNILQQARDFAEQTGPELLDRALAWAYLSETESSFEIEREKPDETKAGLFVRLLKQAHDRRPLDEAYLVELQNSAISNPLERAFQFRTQQNWLHNAAPGAVGVTYVPPPPDTVPELMQALIDFGNRPPAALDPLVTATLVSFGFVFIHPFMDGNGRLSRFLFHHSLCTSGQLPDGFLLPVSIAMKRAESEYLQALQSFSKPVRQLWNVTWLGEATYSFNFLSSTQIYRYWDATPIVEFALRMADQSMRRYLREETQFLQAYDQAYKEVNDAFDIRGSSLTVLLRSCFEQGGRVSLNRRKKYADHVPPEAFDAMEHAVRKARDDFGVA